MSRQNTSYKLFAIVGVITKKFLEKRSFKNNILGEFFFQNAVLLKRDILSTNF